MAIPSREKNTQWTNKLSETRQNVRISELCANPNLVQIYSRWRLYAYKDAPRTLPKTSSNLLLHMTLILYKTGNNRVISEFRHILSVQRARILISDARCEVRWAGLTHDLHVLDGVTCINSSSCEVRRSVLTHDLHVPDSVTCINSSRKQHITPTMRDRN